MVTKLEIGNSNEQEKLLRERGVGSGDFLS
jgi:hypothetical protein